MYRTADFTIYDLKYLDCYLHCGLEYQLLIKSFSIAVRSRVNIKIDNNKYMVRLRSWWQNFIKFYSIIIEMGRKI